MASAAATAGRQQESRRHRGTVQADELFKLTAASSSCSGLKVNFPSDWDSWRPFVSRVLLRAVLLTFQFYKHKYADLHHPP